MISKKQKKSSPIFQKYKLLLSIFRKQYTNVKFAEHNHLEPPPPFYHSLNYIWAKFLQGKVFHQGRTSLVR